MLSVPYQSSLITRSARSGWRGHKNEKVRYQDRQNYLLESDTGIITHPNHVETRFSFRTRILDYIWTGLPMITTEGDYLSDMIKFEGMGIITKDGDESDIARAILKLAQDKDFYRNCRENTEKKRGDFTWEKVNVFRGYVSDIELCCCVKK